MGYEMGLEILGAAPGANVSAAAKRAVSSARKLAASARRRTRSTAKFANRLAQKAQAAAVAAKKAPARPAPAPSRAPAAARPSAPARGAMARAPMMAAGRRTGIRGEVSSVLSVRERQAGIEAAAEYLNSASLLADLITQANTVANNAITVADQGSAAGAPGAAALNALIDEAYADGSGFIALAAADESAALSDFSGFRSKVGNWTSRIQGAVSQVQRELSGAGAGGPPSGGGGGAGGGEGGGEEGGAGGGDSEALRRFREEGVDPFDQQAAAAPEGEESPVEAEALDEGRVAEEGAESPSDEEQQERVEGFDFEWQDIFLPHRAMMRYFKEREGQRTPSPEFKAPAVAKAPEPVADPTKAKRAALAAKRLEALKARAAAFDAQQQAAMSADAQQGPTIMGDEIDFEEVGDIFVAPHEIDITDEQPDPIRSRASKHNGAAYMDRDYPPHGASDGREGGVMEKPSFKIEVFGEDYSRGLDILGAVSTQRGIKKVENVVRSQAQKAGFTKDASAIAGRVAGAKASVPQRAGFKTVKTPGGRQISTLKVNPKNDPKTTIRNARDLAARAKKVASKLEALAKKRAKAPIPVGKTKVRGEDVEIFGLIGDDGEVEIFGVKRSALPTGKVPRLSATRLKKLASKVAKNGGKVASSGKKFESYYKGRVKKINADAKTVAAKLKKGIYSTKTSVRGDDIFGEIEADEIVCIDGVNYHVCEVLGAYCDALSAEICGQDEETTSTEPVSADEAAADPLSAGEADNYGLGPAPTKAPPLQPGVDYLPDPGPDDMNVYSSDPSVPGVEVPVGAVYYQGPSAGHRPMPWQGVGSFRHFWGGANPDTPRKKTNEGGRFPPFLDPAKGGAASGFRLGGGNPSIMDGWYMYLDGDRDQFKFKHDIPGGGTGIGTERTMRERSDLSVEWGWGPLIGNPLPMNPDDAWTKGLRYDVAKDAWFWYRDQAPKFATDADDQARLNKAIQDYKNDLLAAQLEAAEKILQDQLEAKEAEAQAKQQAKEDAAQARKFEQEQKEAEHKAALQAIEDERENKKLDAETERQVRLMEAAEKAALERVVEDREAEGSDAELPIEPEAGEVPSEGEGELAPSEEPAEAEAAE